MSYPVTPRTHFPKVATGIKKNEWKKIDGFKCKDGLRICDNGLWMHDQLGVRE